MTDIVSVSITDSFGFWRAKLNEVITRINGIGTSSAITVTGGTMAGVAISGGSIDGTPIGSTSKAAGKFTSVQTDVPLAVAYGGTGASTASAARTALGCGTMAVQNYDSVSITGGSISGITPLPLASGGTGSSTASGARTALGCGSMASQNSTAVSITGGTMSGVTVGSSVLAESIWSSGDVKITMKAVADSGWVMMNDGTIGSSTSGATTRANSDCETLFKLLWANTNSTWCPIYNSSGVLVTKGATADADWIAGRRIALPKVLGRSLAISGSGSGLTSRALGENLGSENAIVVAHTHTINATAVYGVRPNTTGGDSMVTTTATTTGSTGSSGTGANMQPSVFFNIMIKL